MEVKTIDLRNLGLAHPAGHGTDSTARLGLACLEGGNHTAGVGNDPDLRPRLRLQGVAGVRVGPAQRPGRRPLVLAGIAFACLAPLLLFAGAAIPFIPGLLRGADGVATQRSSLDRIVEKRRALEDRLTALRREQDRLKRVIFTNHARMERRILADSDRSEEIFARILADIDHFEAILARAISGGADP